MQDIITKKNELNIIYMFQVSIEKSYFNRYKCSYTTYLFYIILSFTYAKKIDKNHAICAQKSYIERNIRY